MHKKKLLFILSLTQYIYSAESDLSLPTQSRSSDPYGYHAALESKAKRNINPSKPATQDSVQRQSLLTPKTSTTAIVDINKIASAFFSKQKKLVIPAIQKLLIQIVGSYPFLTKERVETDLQLVLDTALGRKTQSQKETQEYLERRYPQLFEPVMDQDPAAASNTIYDTNDVTEKLYQKPPILTQSQSENSSTTTAQNTQDQKNDSAMATDSQNQSLFNQDYYSQFSLKDILNSSKISDEDFVKIPKNFFISVDSETHRIKKTQNRRNILINTVAPNDLKALMLQINPTIKDTHRIVDAEYLRQKYPTLAVDLIQLRATESERVHKRTQRKNENKITKKSKKSHESDSE